MRDFQSIFAVPCGSPGLIALVYESYFVSNLYTVFSIQHSIMDTPYRRGVPVPDLGDGCGQHLLRVDAPVNSDMRGQRRLHNTSNYVLSVILSVSKCTANLYCICLNTKCPKMYRKSLLHLLKYRFAVYLSRCSTDLRLNFGTHSMCFQLEKTQKKFLH